MMQINKANPQKVCVLGLGYIGLPTASMLATHGFEVVGVDTNDHVVNTVARGDSYIAEPGLRTLVKAAVGSEQLRVAKGPGSADAFIICVPTPIRENHRADLRFVEAAARSITPFLHEGNLIVLESTVPPGTTQGFVKPILQQSGLRAGTDFHLAYCPERVLPGKILTEIVQNSRIIGGINPKSAEMAKTIYEQFVEGAIYLTDATTAEMVKLAENTYRDVNIALANELSRLCPKLGIDVMEVVELANRHPRVNLHRPGPGVGGHCISIDPWFIVEKFPKVAKLIRTAREVNEEQPGYVVQLIHTLTEGINQPKIAILGVTYKGNVDDTRQSPSLDVIQLLREQGYQVAAHDPHVRDSKFGLVSLEEACGGADCVVILAAHNEFQTLDPQILRSVMRRPCLLDTCRIIDREQWKRAGFHVCVLGMGQETER
jgi:UDP-N-acetyl-D-mannosaminuronic acid dehydrogenase